MASKQELIETLLKEGYTGTTSLSKPELERRLSSLRAVQSDDFDNGVEIKDHYGTVRKGDQCRLEGEPRGRYEFIRHYKSYTQEYVELKGGRRLGYVATRCVTPSKLRTDKGKLP